MSNKVKQKQYYRTWWLKNKEKASKWSNAWRKKNKDKSAKYQQKYLATHNSKQDKERRARYNRKRYIAVKYKLTMEQAEELLTNSHACPICGKTFVSTRDKNIDHNHNTGKVRAILCSKCNMGLGYFDDSVDKLMKAAAYLKKYE